MGMKNIKHFAPESIEAAVEIFQSEDGALYFAGGTDLIPRMKYGLIQATGLIDLEGIEALKKIEERADGIFIGSMITMSDLTENRMIAERLSPVACAARCVASPQIRNIGTIGGNIFQERRCMYFNQSAEWRRHIPPCYQLGGELCHQIPKAKTCQAIYYSDLAPILIAYGALAEIHNGETCEKFPLEEVIERYILHDERKGLITGFIIPYCGPGAIGKFLKYSVRSSIDFALSSIGMLFVPGNQKQGKESIRIVAGAASPVPLRLNRTEHAILENLPDVYQKKQEIYDIATDELKSQSSLIRDTAVPFKARRNSLLIIADILRDFFRDLNML
ncbi:MAG: FAD binding domain-containing protein [Deltaproteobacteria bacterium]|nr:FAD binding domain-containing protein [Deltaproteobacteria bacterium]